MLPSARPEKLYPELPPDNFRFSRIGDIEKQIFQKIENYRKVAQKYKKAQSATHYTVGLSLGRSLYHWRRLEPYGPWNHCGCIPCCCAYKP